MNKHKPARISKNWFTDPIKSKYVSGPVGSLSFTCRQCGTYLSCESFRYHVTSHEEKIKKKDDQCRLEESFKVTDAGK